MAAAVIIAVLLTEPFSQLAVGGIFKMMGSKYIVFDVNILESYVIYPLAVFAVTVLAAGMVQTTLNGGGQERIIAV